MQTEYDLRILREAARNLLDEANKAFATIGSDEAFLEPLAKVQSLAAHAHAIAGEISGDQPATSGNTTNDPQGRYYDDAHL